MPNKTKQRNKRKKETISQGENCPTSKTQRQTMDQNGGGDISSVQCGQNAQNVSFHQTGQSFTQPSNVHGHSPMYSNGNNGNNFPYLILLNSASPALPSVYPQQSSTPATPGSTNHDMFSTIMQRLESMDSKLSQVDGIQTSIKSFSTRMNKFEQKMKNFETKITESKQAKVSTVTAWMTC